MENPEYTEFLKDGVFERAGGDIRDIRYTSMQDFEEKVF